MEMNEDLLTPDPIDEKWEKYVATFFKDGRIKVITNMPIDYELEDNEKEVSYRIYCLWHSKAIAQKIIGDMEYAIQIDKRKANQDKPRLVI